MQSRRGKTEKKFGILDSVAINIGSMIGVGVFLIGAIAINTAGESVLLSIIIAAVLAFLSAICVTQLSSVLSKAGGVYECTRPFTPSLGFASGILIIGVLLSLAAAIGVRSILYLNVLFLSGMTLLESTSLSIAMIVLAAIVVLSKPRFSIKMMILLVALSVFALMVAFVFGVGDINDVALSLSFNASNYVSVLFSAGLFFLAFSGFTMLTRSRSSIANPDRTIKKATYLSIILVFIILSLFAVLLINLLSQTTISNVGALLERTYLGSYWLILLMSAVRIVAMFGLMMLCFLTASKTMQSMSENKDLIYSLKMLNSNGKPAESTFLCLFITILLALVVSSSLLLYFAGAAIVLAFVFVDLSALQVALKKRRDAKVRASFIGNRCFPIIPVLGILGNLAVFFSLGVAPVAAALMIFVISLFHFKFIRPRLPKKAVRRNPVAVSGSGGEFIKG